MDEVHTNEPMLRRVGLNEGLQHMAGAAIGLVAVALPFQGWVAAGAMLGGASLWAVAYVALRAARQRIWFGSWDALSFGFVWSYALVLALALKMMLIRWI